ncbi:MAG: recombination protein NinB [Acidobacteria bacterium]|nr:recombination protein NinB [Acidobacteriota bacterium]
MTDWTFSATVDAGGRLQFDNRAAFASYVSTLAGKRVVLSVTAEKRHRSLRQNAYWWGVCVHLVSEHTGYEPEEVHDLAKKMFIPKRVTVRGKNGRLRGRFTIGGSTTKLKSDEMTEFIERFRRWAAQDLGVVIPDPGEVAA